jgi:predicted ATPase
MPPRLAADAPWSPSLFIGRAAELDLLRRSFDEGARLVTVLGAGGMGKTYLARWFARSAPRARFIDLSSATNGDELFAAVAAGIAVRLPRVSGHDELARHLAEALRADGPALFLLDNFEHLARFAPASVDVWLGAAPEARFLVTSREPLGLGEEVQLRLGPFRVDEGVTFFAARARALAAGRELTADEHAIVEQIVRRVDGIPLAIELAAARLPIQSPAEILDRLRHRFALLGGRRRDVPRRHATLEAALDWSWNLLDDDERLAFLQCSVFSARFSLDAAEAVLSLAHTPPIDAVASLVDKSLLTRADAPEEPARFAMFESLRAYAAAKLDRAPAVRASALARHARYFAAFAEGSAAVASVDALAAELPDLLDVLRRARETPDEAARVAVALEELFYTRGPSSRSLAVLDVVASALDRVADPALAGRAILVRASIRRVSGDVGGAEEDVRRAAERLPAGDPAHARVLLLSGNLARDRFLVREAYALFTAAIEQARASGDARTLALALSNRAATRYDTTEEDPGAAEALAIGSRAGDLRVVATVSVNRAIMRWIFGAVDEARAHAEAALSALQEIGDHELEGIARIVLGTSLACTGDLARAEAELREAGRLARTLGRHFFLPIAPSFLGMILLWGEGRRSEARAAFEEALALGAAGGPEVVARGGLGVLAVEEGDLARAEAELTRARDALALYPEPNLPFVVEVLAGLLDLAHARADPSGAARRASAARRVEGWFDPWDGPGRPARLRGELRLGALGALLAGPVLLRALASGGVEVEGRRRPACAPPPEPAAAITVGREQRWFRVGAGAPVDLSTRQVFRRLLAALVAHHRGGGDAPLTNEALVAAAWPGERITRAAARNRLNNAIATLRSLGLRGLLVTEPRGYRLSPDVTLVTHD